jgi:hypothetical protein
MAPGPSLTLASLVNVPSELCRRLVLVRARWLISLVALTVLALATTAGARASFQLGLQDVAFDGNATTQQTADGYDVMSAVHGSLVRINAFWYAIAPSAPVSGANPADSAYDWSAVDTAVRNAALRHVTPILTLSGAPQWAQGPNEPDNPAFGFGVWNPSPADFGQFAQAAATRYNGQFPDPLHPGQFLPRVKYFEVWNEENIPLFLAAPDLYAAYKALIGAAYPAIKSVDSSDQVVMGGLAPLGYSGGPGPLKFAAEMMCLRRVGTRFVRLSGCTPAPFDIFAEHPYSLGVSPTETVPKQVYDDVRVGDVYKVRNLLNAAARLGTLGSRRPPFWVTEWGWATNPPDRKEGNSFKLAARYVAYSMYEMFKQGTSVIIWQEIHDGTANGLPGSGLETKTGQRKPSMQAFTFPFIASVSGTRGFGWGRAPESRPVKVTVQRQTRRGWTTVAHAKTGSDGVFTAHFSATGNGSYRALVSHGPKSLGYFSAPIARRASHG